MSLARQDWLAKAMDKKESLGKTGQSRLLLAKNLARQDWPAKAMDRKVSLGKTG